MVDKIPADQEIGIEVSEWYLLNLPLNRRIVED
jgi:hypothetical protein